MTEISNFMQSNKINDVSIECFQSTIFLSTPMNFHFFCVIDGQCTADMLHRVGENQVLDFRPRVVFQALTVAGLWGRIQLWTGTLRLLQCG